MVLGGVRFLMSEVPLYGGPGAGGDASWTFFEAFSLEKHPDLEPFFDDLTRAKSAKELKEHLETCVL